MEDNERTDDDEISLIDLFAVLWRRKKMIIAVVASAMVFAVGFSVLSLLLPPEKSFLPNLYTPRAQMLINDESSSGGGIASMISSSGLGSLAKLGGVNVPGGSTYSALAGYLAQSDTVLDAVTDEFGLVERYKIKKSPRASSRKALKKVLVSDFDEDTGVFTLKFTDRDPEFARRVVNFVVDMLESRFLSLGIDKNLLQKENLETNIKNSHDEILRLQKQIAKIERSVSNVYAPAGAPSIMMEVSIKKLELSAQEEVYKQLKAQYELLKVSMASERPVFQILEYAEVPDMKSKPSRGMLCVIITFAAAFVSVFVAFLLNALSNIRNDPKAMAKLKAESL